MRLRHRIVACPGCGDLASHAVLLSGTTSLARVYTDGHQDSPVLPRPMLVGRCAGCSTFYWLFEAQEAGGVEHAPPMGELSEREYYAAIDGGLGRDAEKQRTLRIRAWWRQNDKFRRGVVRRLRPWRLTAEGRANMQALVDTLDDTQADDRLMKAELLRQLGEFDRAGALLSKMQDYAAARIRQLCDRRDARVRLLVGR